MHVYFAFVFFKSNLQNDTETMKGIVRIYQFSRRRYPLHYFIYRGLKGIVVNPAWSFLYEGLHELRDLYSSFKSAYPLQDKLEPLQDITRLSSPPR